MRLFFWLKIMFELLEPNKKLKSKVIFLFISFQFKEIAYYFLENNKIFSFSFRPE